MVIGVSLMKSTGTTEELHMVLTHVLMQLILPSDPSYARSWLSYDELLLDSPSLINFWSENPAYNVLL